MTPLTLNPLLQAIGGFYIQFLEIEQYPLGPMRERVLDRIRDQFDRDLAYKFPLADFEKRRG